jgi:hypothetical protein
MDAATAAAAAGAEADAAAAAAAAAAASSAGFAAQLGAGGQLFAMTGADGQPVLQVMPLQLDAAGLGGLGQIDLSQLDPSTLQVRVMGRAHPNAFAHPSACVHRGGGAVRMGLHALVVVLSSWEIWCS